jgi:predicted  nucleic acid-binding Zn-ribbon protein
MTDDSRPTASEILSSLSSAGVVLRAIPPLVKAIESFADLEATARERERALATLQQQIEDTKAAERARSAQAQAEYETAAAERRVEITSLDHRVATKRSELVELEGALAEARATIEESKRIRAEHAEQLRRLSG